ncbi:hypothetical protein [Snodgrassella alvi]|jgi:putative transposase|uniref:Uncharacterized protein n=1 Tax=Snodgrassella alvi TaxID=1196083 RepID=A0A855FKV8_9NEIS|nr:hypothetical protein [Snodgrassella alvi]PIT59639.1 hypothetical protein BHC57_04870 [Snodgrassella alvi]
MWAGIPRYQTFKEALAENGKLKQMFTVVRLKSQLQEEIIKKALVPTKAREVWAFQLQPNHFFTIAMNCSITSLSYCTHYSTKITG